MITKSAPSISAATPPAQAATLLRSTINRSVETAREVLAAANIALPPFASWSVEDWAKAGDEMQEVRDCMLGWDVTDFGSGRFHELGRTLFTLRNGRTNDSRYPKPYAEKLLIEPTGQRSPMHYHRSKREDIVNRAGGNVIVVLRSVGADGKPGSDNIVVQIDGKRHQVASGSEIRLRPGDSLTITPKTYHQFWAEAGTGMLFGDVRYSVSSEVSSVCDDWCDNVFIDDWALRFPTIIEDEPRRCYLCHEYPAQA